MATTLHVAQALAGEHPPMIPIMVTMRWKTMMTLTMPIMDGKSMRRTSKKMKLGGTMEEDAWKQ